jgi:hypothetical protein
MSLCTLPTSSVLHVTGDKWCLTVPPLSQVQQSSFYGYTGMLPKRYTQGVMTGESEY